jgi:aryl-alcohol dehydrogenase-like predicted oxidoreductase
MEHDFPYATLGKTKLTVSRLGLAATYRPGKRAVYRAVDEGVNYFFWFNFDNQMIKVLRDILKSGRENYVVATGAYNLIYGHPNLRRTLEKRLRTLKTDYIDVFHFLGVLKEREFKEETREELYRFKKEGKIRFVGISTHNRKFAGQLASEGKLDVIMMRYNAAHRGAEEDIFPFLEKHDPGIVSYTATCWRFLLRRPRGWPRDGQIPDAGMCYRFVLSNPHVHVCITSPTNLKQLEENLKTVRLGLLSDEEMAFMRNFGDAVYKRKKRFLDGRYRP